MAFKYTRAILLLSLAVLLAQREHAKKLKDKIKPHKGTVYLWSLSLVCFLSLCKTASTLLRRNLKRSYISTIRPTVDINPSRDLSFSENALQTGGNWKRRFSFSCESKTFWKGSFSKRWCNDNHTISITEFSSNTNPKSPVIVAFFLILPVKRVDGKRSRAFSEWNLFSNFSGVEGT